jgi:hypothetical protein
MKLTSSIPHFSSATLTALWKSKTLEHTHRVLKYYFQRVVMYVELIDRAEIITKNAYVSWPFPRGIRADNVESLPESLESTSPQSCSEDPSTKSNPSFSA